MFGQSLTGHSRDTRISPLIIIDNYFLTNTEKVVALYKYTALNPDELSFEKDDIIKMISKEEPEWWKGELNGKVGLFPSNYVQPACK